MNPVNLPELPEIVWINDGNVFTSKGEFVRIDLDFFEFAGDTGQQNYPVTISLAPVLEQMIDECHTRYDLFGLPRFNFAFGLGTTDAAGQIAALGDGGFESFSPGFVARPVFAELSGLIHHWNRYLQTSGGWTPAQGDPDVVEYTVTVQDNTGINGQYVVDGPGASPPTGPLNGERTLSNGVKFRFRRIAPEGGIGSSNPASFYKVGTKWTFKAYRKVQRTPYGIAMVLLSQLCNAIEDMITPEIDQFPWRKGQYDFGSGSQDAIFAWMEADHANGYISKALVYDHDVERMGDYYEDLGNGGIFVDTGHNPRLHGMLGTIGQIRRILNDTRWVTVSEHIGPTGSIISQISELIEGSTSDEVIYSAVSTQLNYLIGSGDEPTTYTDIRSVRKLITITSDVKYEVFDTVRTDLNFNTVPGLNHWRSFAFAWWLQHIRYDNPTGVTVAFLVSITTEELTEVNDPSPSNVINIELADNFMDKSGLGCYYGSVNSEAVWNTQSNGVLPIQKLEELLGEKIAGDNESGLVIVPPGTTYIVLAAPINFNTLNASSWSPPLPWPPIDLQNIDNRSRKRAGRRVLATFTK